MSRSEDNGAKTTIFMNSDKHSGSQKPSNSDLNDLRLVAARQRLAESRDKQDAIEGLREIVANLLGSEEIGLFKVDHASGTFKVCWSFGIDLTNYDLTRALGDAGIQRVKRGEFHIDLSPAGHSGPGARAQAFIPIRAASETVGVLAILRLLPQKAAFDSTDMDLFKLLSDEAAQPLFGEQSRSQRAPRRQGMGA
jgi:GAF domain-containing protein